MAEINDTQRDAIIAAIRDGRKIEAIKLYREATREGLKESKDFIDALHDRLHKENPDEFPPRASGCNVAALSLAISITLFTFLIWIMALNR